LASGNVNIYNLAKNAGTGVQMIERFYAKKFQHTPDMVRNLQGERTDVDRLGEMLGE